VKQHAEQPLHALSAQGKNKTLLKTHDRAQALKINRSSVLQIPQKLFAV
jgi:hypothetical protein